MANSAETRFPLYCGSTSSSSDILEYYQDSHLPVSAQMLPQSPMPPPWPQHSKVLRSTGCGAPVHAGARQIRLTTGLRWSASPEDVTKSVVPLERMYFAAETAKALKLGEGPCGCRSSGVGCCICGNALGARLVRCPTHAIDSHAEIYSFLHDAVTAGAVVFRQPTRSREPERSRPPLVLGTLGLPSVSPSSSDRTGTGMPQTNSGPIQRLTRRRRTQTLRTAESVEQYFRGGVLSTEDISTDRPSRSTDSPANLNLGPAPTVNATQLARDIREISDAVRAEHDRLETWIAAARLGTAATDDVFGRLLAGIERLRDIVAAGPRAAAVEPVGTGTGDAAEDGENDNENDSAPSTAAVTPRLGPLPRPPPRDENPMEGVLPTSTDAVAEIRSPAQQSLPLAIRQSARNVSTAAAVDPLTSLSDMQQAIARVNGLTAELGARVGALRVGTRDITGMSLVRDANADADAEGHPVERRRRVDFDR